MKKEVAVICKAYENLFGAQIKKENAKCEDEKAAIAYAANFVAGLNNDNAVKIRFIGEDADIEYSIDADKLEEVSEKISALVNAYKPANTKEENNVKKEINKFEVGKKINAYKTYKRFGAKPAAKKYELTVVARTNCYVTFKGDGFGCRRFKIQKYADNVEYCATNLGLISAYAQYDEVASTGTVNVDVENYVEDDGSNDDADEENEVLTLDYNFDDEEDDDDELIDEAEVITVEEKVIATADLEKKLAVVQAEIKTYKATLTESETDLDTQQKAIMEYASKIYLAKHNAEKLRLAIMMQESMIEESEEEAAALEAEILNRKITESYVDSIVTAAAFNASIQAEEMAAANNAEPVTFELERFNDGETVIEETAEIDTSISVAEVPIVDDTEKNLLDEYNALEKEIEELNEYIEQLQVRRFQVGVKLKAAREKKFEFAITAAKSAIAKANEHYAKMDLYGGAITGQDGRVYWIEGDWDLIDCYVNYDGALEIEFNSDLVASYKDVATGNKALRDFTAAIKRGDTEFTFPADDSEKERKKTA